MQLNEIYQPINRELAQVERVIKSSLVSSRYKSILKVNKYLLEAKGKRLRPALLILCAKAVVNQGSRLGFRHTLPEDQLIKIASSIELIHTASLIHDDVIDHAGIRHNKPTVGSRWGEDVAISLGDYLYAEAFRLISDCGNPDIIRCISFTTKSMCEGELLQVCERDNLHLLKQRYLIMVRKKTAALFACACQAGAISVDRNRLLQQALKEYGLNFGIAFQIVDDCSDLVGKQKDLGKLPGADFKAGEVTLPVLNLILESPDKGRILSLLRQPHNQKAFEKLRERFIDSKAFLKTKENTYFYIRKAKDNLTKLSDSCFKQSLSYLADHVMQRLNI